MRKSAITRRSFLAALAGGAATGCATGGGYGFLGYTTEPNYDPELRTVYVPQFRTKVFETGPYRGLEITLTRFVVNAIEAKTPMKVISDPGRADTELQGTVTRLAKFLNNRTPFNEAREVELFLTTEIVWFDLRPGHEGEIISNPRKKDPVHDAPFDPAVLAAAKGPEAPIPIPISESGKALPEVGETSTSALDQVLKRTADRIVFAMEKRW